MICHGQNGRRLSMNKYITVDRTSRFLLRNNDFRFVASIAIVADSRESITLMKVITKRNGPTTAVNFYHF